MASASPAGSCLRCEWRQQFF
ncbi:uncharacterized protein G2W53_004827 [Senna tora]|uniref:Uncharacterized protein n=1 Tax=Senna tora TaxID=362788 RepID=A0A834XCH6_9FABA|nr:uncharacterized protein G2W53_004827 [Senna tora]